MSDANNLAMDFSTSRRSMAIIESKTGNVVAEAATTGGFETIAGDVDNLLEAAKLCNKDIESLTIGIGPGSYTGIRAVIAFAQGWNLATGVRLYTVPTADAIAASYFATSAPTATLHILIDAQRHEFYHTAYNASGVISPLEIISWEAAQALIGDESGEKHVCGPDLPPELFPSAELAAAAAIYPSAVEIGRIALQRRIFTDPEHLAPIYLRPIQFVKAPPARKI